MSRSAAHCSLSIVTTAALTQGEKQSKPVSGRIYGNAFQFYYYKVRKIRKGLAPYSIAPENGWSGNETSLVRYVHTRYSTGLSFLAKFAFLFSDRKDELLTHWQVASGHPGALVTLYSLLARPQLPYVPNAMHFIRVYGSGRHVDDVIMTYKRSRPAIPATSVPGSRAERIGFRFLKKLQRVGTA